MEKGKRSFEARPFQFLWKGILAFTNSLVVRALVLLHVCRNGGIAPRRRSDDKLHQLHPDTEVSTVRVKLDHIFESLASF